MWVSLYLIFEFAIIIWTPKGSQLILEIGRVSLSKPIFWSKKGLLVK